MTTCPNCGKACQPGEEVCPSCGLVFPFTTDTLAPGIVLQNRYAIERLYHSGGMGYVYLALDKKLYGRSCIVKQVKEPVRTEADQKKLEEEALRMSRLNHPGIANILDHFIENGYYFLVVERIQGKTLSEVFEEQHGKLAEGEVVKWALAMCEVVEYIHKEGVIHRDISPDNVMLTDDGHIKFIDFGTLREFRHIAVKGTAGMGKYGYTPPEQWQGKPVPQSDIFALGATVYYLLSGSLPLSKEYVSGQSPQKTDFRPEFPPIRTKNPAVSPQLEAVLQRALQLEVNTRYASARELGQALRSPGKLETIRPWPETKIPSFPIISIDVNRIDFTEVKPGTTRTSSFRITTNETRDHVVEIRTSQPWIGVSPTRLNVRNVSQTVQVTADATNLLGGMSDTGNIDIVTDGGTERIKIYLETVKSNPLADNKTDGQSNWIWIGIVAVGLLVSIWAIMGNIKCGGQQNTSGPKAVPSSVWEEPDGHSPISVRSSISAQPGELCWKFVSNSDTVIVGPEVLKDIAYIGVQGKGVYALRVEDGAQKWSFPLIDDINYLLTSTASDNRLFIFTDDKSYALNAETGSHLWELSKGTYYDPLIYGTILYLPNNNGFCAIDIVTGRQIWQCSTRAVGGSAVSNGTVYFKSPSLLHAANADSGIEKFTFEPPWHLLAPGPKVSNGIVYINSNNGINAIDSVTGNERWHYPKDKDTNSNAFLVGIFGTKLYILEWKQLVAMDSQSGKYEWSYPSGEFDWAKDVYFMDCYGLEYDNNLYFQAPDNFLYCIDAENGKMRWKLFNKVSVQFQRNDSNWATTYQPLISGGNLYLWSDNGVYAVDCVSGNTKWRLSSSNAIRPEIVDNGILYGTDILGNLYAVKAY